MGPFIWFINAASAVQTMRGYTPGQADGKDGVEISGRMARLNHRIDAGEVLNAADFPTEYRALLADPNTKLPLPMWQSSLLHVRDDVVAVLQGFELGNTLFVPIRVTLPQDSGVRTDFQTMAVGNLKPTIDPAQSERLPRGRLRRPRLLCDGPVHPGVVALPAALDGPDIWTDPQVARTIFVTDRLAQTLRAQEYGPRLGLKKVRVVAEAP